MPPQNKQWKKWFMVIALAVAGLLVAVVVLLVLSVSVVPAREGEPLNNLDRLMIRLGLIEVHRDSSDSPYRKAESSLKNLWLSMMGYAEDHEGRLPEALSQLVPVYLEDDSHFSQTRLTMPGARLDELNPEVVILTRIFTTAHSKKEFTLTIHADGKFDLKQ